jgi:hypothetical protein
VSISKDCDQWAIADEIAVAFGMECQAKPRTSAASSSSAGQGEVSLLLERIRPGALAGPILEDI